jgi:hypothetical protein
MSEELKMFDREDFQRVKDLQTAGKSRVEIMSEVGFGKETVRKAMRAGNWPQYRKNEKSALAARAHRRMMNKIYTRDDEVADLPGYTNAEGDQFLAQTNEGEFSDDFKLKAARGPSILQRIRSRISAIRG